MKTKIMSLKSTLAFTLVCLGMLLGTSAFAETNLTDVKAEAQAKILTDQMKQKLALTPEQYQLAYDINLKYLKNNSGVVNKAESKLGKLKAVKNTQTTKEEEMKSILTPEQFQKYQGVKDNLKTKAIEKYKKLKL